MEVGAGGAEMDGAELTCWPPSKVMDSGKAGGEKGEEQAAGKTAGPEEASEEPKEAEGTSDELTREGKGEPERGEARQGGEHASVDVAEVSPHRARHAAASGACSAALRTVRGSRLASAPTSRRRPKTSMSALATPRWMVREDEDSAVKALQLSLVHI